MSIIKLLSSSLGEKGSKANISLAKHIADTEDKDAVKELVENLSNKEKRIQSDCIKILYETAYLKPELIAAYFDEFLKLIRSKNNRLVWGAMIALMTMVDIKRKELYASLDLISEVIEKGSVITIDAGIGILAGLTKYPEYTETVSPLLLEQLRKCPFKQFPQYAEKASIAINKTNAEPFLLLIENRMNEAEKDSQIKRLEKVFKSIHL